MISKEIMEKILEAGVRAPSGENCQPWRFEVAGDILTVFNIPERDQSLYNFNQFGSFVAHGALMENIRIAASHFGYEVSITLFPKSAGPNCTGALRFKENPNIAKDPLYECISRRVSNRTAYQALPFTDAQRATLVASGAVFVEERDKRHRLANAISFGDRLLFENEVIHDFLFSHINWNLKEASAAKAGFYIKELGLVGPQEAIFRLLRKNSILRFFKRIGFPKFAAKSNVGLYENSSAMGAIIMKGNTPEDFVQGGMRMERVWLAATEMGYDIQPLTAILFFMQRILGNAADDFTPDQIRGVKDAYAVIEKEFATEGRTPVMLFRIGKGKPLHYQSLRLPPSIVYT